MLNKPLKMWHLIAVLGLTGVLYVTGTTIAARSGNQVYFRKAVFTVPANGSGGKEARCERGDLPTGGGATYGGASPDVVDLRASYPWDSGDDDPRPDNGWAVSIKNESAAPVQITLWALCL